MIVAVKDACILQEKRRKMPDYSRILCSYAGTTRSYYAMPYCRKTLRLAVGQRIKIIATPDEKAVIVRIIAVTMNSAGREVYGVEFTGDKKIG